MRQPAACACAASLCFKPTVCQPSSLPAVANKAPAAPSASLPAAAAAHSVHVLSPAFARGLPNLLGANACYANALLVALFSIADFRRGVMASAASADIARRQSPAGASANIPGFLEDLRATYNYISNHSHARDTAHARRHSIAIERSEIDSTRRVNQMAVGKRIRLACAGRPPTDAQYELILGQFRHAASHAGRARSIQSPMEDLSKFFSSLRNKLHVELQHRNAAPSRCSARDFLDTFRCGHDASIQKLTAGHGQGRARREGTAAHRA